MRRWFTYLTYTTATRMNMHFFTYPFGWLGSRCAYQFRFSGFVPSAWSWIRAVASVVPDPTTIQCTPALFTSVLITDGDLRG